MSEIPDKPEKRQVARRTLLTAIGAAGVLALFGEVAKSASEHQLNHDTPAPSTPTQSPKYLEEAPPMNNPNQLPSHGEDSEPVPTSHVIDMPRDRAWTYNFRKLADGPLPKSDWRFETGTWLPDLHEEAEIYTDRVENVRVEGGELVIEARKERFGGREFTSARIDTHGIFDFTYGTLEVEMMLPPGVGTWPAAWLMPATNKYNPADYGVSSDDPFYWAMNGEIDFMEAIGRIPNENIPGAHTIAQLHRGTIYTPGKINDAYGAFHRYGVTKTPDKIGFTIDGEEYASRVRTSNDPREWPYDQPYYLILNLAMGGTWAGEDKANYPPYGIDDTPGSWKLRTRSVSYKPL